MHIEFVEISNYRKLHATRVDIAETQTLFVGANNSGKTSAMLALRQFLKDKGRFSTRDVTASNWVTLEKLAAGWSDPGENAVMDPEAFNTLLPALDVWISVEDSEFHHVAHLIPSLDWSGGKIGVRIRLEAQDFASLVADFLNAKRNADLRVANYKAGKENPPEGFSLWPKSFQDYLDRRFRLKLRAYLLDPKKVVVPENDIRAKPQRLVDNCAPLERHPFSGLIHVREIAAQRGFADASETSPDESINMSPSSSGSRNRLSNQFQDYFRHHLDPNKDPTDEDVSALGEFHMAQSAFDHRLEAGFQSARKELESLGYPGISNPKLSISTNIKPTDGLNHPAAVQYDIGGGSDAIRLPEDYSGLGFQNLISMVFQLMRFRDDWMRVGKLSARSEGEAEAVIEPLQIILVEEPEAHLHAQVQQVFIRKAYDVLRNHEALGENAAYRTQFIVSTHSSHIVHEVDFGHLRYFKRLLAKEGGIPTSEVTNLSMLFGTEDATTQFVQRYLKATHCDLFFADGVILLEGAAERILVPHFIRNKYPDLAARYISLLEIGGSHAHKLKPLIDVLSIPALIITDIDASQKSKSVRPQPNKGFKTGNMVLKSWVPKKTEIDDLLNEVRVPSHTGKGGGIVGVVYQRPIEVKNATDAATVVPSTFEDALALSNIELMVKLHGVTMTNKFAKIISDGTSAEKIAEKLYKRLHNYPQKAAFVLDVLSTTDFEEFEVPAYIDGGLNWLSERLAQTADAQT
ncbi:MAG: AAA family ATPase [Aestuariivita sp.]|nr:AAA family ATPase [Aestuariivita sp.]MCY4347605.1 AAA family ATPase [Aestuariivita sp.]